MKKNSVCILALLLAALLALSACGGKDTTTQPGGNAPAGNEPAGERGDHGLCDLCVADCGNGNLPYSQQ